MKKKINKLINCAVIFCGGKGSRLGLIGKKKNKSLLLVKNKPIIYYIINKLIKENFDKIIFPLGYKSNDIKKYVINTFSEHISKFTFVNTGINSELPIRISKIKSYLPATGSVLILNGDTIFDFKLKNFFTSHLRSNKNLSLATFNPKIDFGMIEIKKNKAVKFNKSIFVSDFYIDKKKYLAYSGFFLSKSEYLKKFNFNSKIDFEIDMFNKSIKAKNINFFKVRKGFCFAIDNVKSLLYANNFLNL